jgi:hypothetical protein
MGMLNNLIDTALMVGNILSIKENHTEARTKEEKQKQRERRRNISDIRNAAFLIKRFIR